MPEQTRAENIRTGYSPDEEITTYKEALAAFVDAMGRLTEAWERVDFSGANVPDQGEPYPFAESFDELYHGVLAWAHDVQQASDADWGVSVGMTASARAAKIAARAQAVVARYREQQGK